MRLPISLVRSSQHRPRLHLTIAVTIITLLLATVSLTGLLYRGVAKADPPSGSTWNQVFNDDFNGTSLDTSKWNQCYPWGESDPAFGCNNGSDGSQSWYQSSQVSVNGGYLHLTAQKTSVVKNGNTYNWISGLLTTHNKFHFSGGYLEERFKVTNGKGFWPTFWTGNQDGSWPPELDVSEMWNLPNEVVETIHYKDANGNAQQDEGTDTSQNFTTGFHTVGADWEPGFIQWYVDGKPTFRSTGQKSVYDVFLITSLSVVGPGAFWAPQPDSTTPNTGEMTVDYVRVWQHGSGSTPPPPTATPSPTPTPSNSGWTKCADENSVCNFSGTQQVRYGANNSWLYKTATNSIACNNTTFGGDPAPGVVKACYIQSGGSSTPTPTPTPTSGGSLSGQRATAAASYNLTSSGTRDWAHWGRGGTYGNFDHKSSGGSQISNVSTTSGGHYGGWSDTARTVSWSDGTPTGSNSGDHGYIWSNGANNTGFTFTVPADTTQHTLVIYAGGNGATSKITAHLSDGSAADYSDTQTSTGLYQNVYTITFKAASAGQTLTITYLKTAENGGTGGSADLDAAWLS